ncbi:hypothetical protein [Foetidibacter luteolus]|uniref:hypothetical protein n=1 Tax=Foetidibacter luteolus TaxID=2608880 RepID=UPI00129A2CE0|nr:hypothetical protein [Foetidibacter luteolus]
MSSIKRQYNTVVSQAKKGVPGFADAYAKFIEKATIEQSSKSLLVNYSRSLDRGEKFHFDVEQCPCCKTGKMITLLSFGANGPPL